MKNKQNLNIWFCILVAILLCNSSYAQISSVKLESFKDYDNGTRIGYYQIEGIKDINEQYFIQKELRKEESVSKFFLYDKENGYNRCMIKTNNNLNEIDLTKLIDLKIKNYNSLKNAKYNSKWEFYKIIYDIPEDCPILKYTEINEDNKDVFISEMKEWKASNFEKYNEIKHLKNEIEILNNQK